MLPKDSMMLHSALRRKAELSFNIVVVAVLAVIVLIVMVSIFYSKSGAFGEELTKCNGRCVKTASECRAGREVAVLKTSCNYDNKVEDICCQPIPG